MTKAWLVLITGAVLAAVSLAPMARAQETTNPNSSIKGAPLEEKGLAPKGEMSGKGRMLGGSKGMWHHHKGKMGMMGHCPMAPMMMQNMGKRYLVATKDGGVVVMVGNTLIKYDKELRMVKEATVHVDMAGMQKDMADMMKSCPMMKHGDNDNDNDEGASEQPEQ